MTSDILDLILPDIPRFYTALAEWLACFVCMYWAKRRIRGWKFIVFSGTGGCRSDHGYSDRKGQSVRKTE